MYAKKKKPSPNSKLRSKLKLIRWQGPSLSDESGNVENWQNYYL